MEELILASQSPRRKEILKQFDIPFTPLSSPLIEMFTTDPPEDQVTRLSKEKIETLLKIHPDLSSHLILGADTCISYNGSIIGKPACTADARSMLEKFSGHTHQVITGLTLYNGKTGKYLQEQESAEVIFAKLSNEEREWYLSTKEWEGVAGGYRIQGLGALLIESIHGSYYNIMGLPIRLFYGMLIIQNPRFRKGRF